MTDRRARKLQQFGTIGGVERGSSIGMASNQTDPGTVSNTPPPTGPLSGLELSQYDISRLEYPIEGLKKEIPSYITFYINLPDVAKYESVGLTTGGISVSDQNLDKSRGDNTALNDIVGAALTGSVLKATEEFAGDLISGDVVGAAAAAGKKGILRAAGKTFVKFGLKVAGVAAVGSLSNQIQKKPRYNRIKGSISLYMPDTVFHTNSHDYDVQSLTDALGFLGAGERLSNLLPGASEDQVMKNITGSEAVGRILERTGLTGSGFTDFQLRSQGAALNPQLEVVFKSTPNRQFIYDFKFQPRSKKEADAVLQIIRQFKFYAAPDLADGTGLYYIPPAQFDIQYMFKGAVNEHIGKISSCVLENIDVNYSSAGQFATFDDGMPVQINMQLRFKEVDTITRRMVAEGF